MIRTIFYSSVVVFFLLLPGNGIAAGGNNTEHQSLQHYQGITLSACLKEVAPEADLLSFQKKYLHTAEKTCLSMLAKKRRKTAIVTPVEGQDITTTEKDTQNTVTKTADTPPSAAQQKQQHYWRNDGTH